MLNESNHEVLVKIIPNYKLGIKILADSYIMHFYFSPG